MTPASSVEGQLPVDPSGPFVNPGVPNELQSQAFALRQQLQAFAQSQTAALLVNTEASPSALLSSSARQHDLQSLSSSARQHDLQSLSSSARQHDLQSLSSFPSAIGSGVLQNIPQNPRDLDSLVAQLVQEGHMMKMQTVPSSLLAVVEASKKLPAPKRKHQPEGRTGEVSSGSQTKEASIPTNEQVSSIQQQHQQHLQGPGSGRTVANAATSITDPRTTSPTRHAPVTTSTSDLQSEATQMIPSSARGILSTSWVSLGQELWQRGVTLGLEKLMEQEQEGTEGEGLKEAAQKQVDLGFNSSRRRGLVGTGQLNTPCLLDLNQETNIGIASCEVTPEVLLNPSTQATVQEPAAGSKSNELGHQEKSSGGRMAFDLNVEALEDRSNLESNSRSSSFVLDLNSAPAVEDSTEEASDNPRTGLRTSGKGVSDTWQAASGFGSRTAVTRELRKSSGSSESEFRGSPGSLVHRLAATIQALHSKDQSIKRPKTESMAGQGLPADALTLLGSKSQDQSIEAPGQPGTGQASSSTVLALQSMFRTGEIARLENKILSRSPAGGQQVKASVAALEVGALQKGANSILMGKANPLAGGMHGSFHLPAHVLTSVCASRPKLCGETPGGPGSLILRHGWGAGSAERVPGVNDALALGVPASIPEEKSPVRALVKQKVMGAAEALEKGNLNLFHELCSQLKPFAKKRGSAIQRVTWLTLHSLALRAQHPDAGMACISKPYNYAVQDMEKARMWYYTGAPTCPFTVIALSGMILPKLNNKEHVHVVNFGEVMLPQYPSLMKLLQRSYSKEQSPSSASFSELWPRASASNPNSDTSRGVKATKGPLKSFRITNVNLVPLTRPGRFDFAMMQGLGRVATVLRGAAMELGVDFEFHGLDVGLENLEDLGKILKRPGEAIAIVMGFDLKYLIDEATEGGSPQSHFLQCVKRLQPDTVAVVDYEADAAGTSLGHRCTASLDLHTAIFEGHDSLAQPEFRKFLATFEQQHHGLNMCGMIACDGIQRRVRPQTLVQRREMFERIGYRLARMSPAVGDAEYDMLRCYSDGFGLLQDEISISLVWQGRPLYSASSWTT